MLLIYSTQVRSSREMLDECAQLLAILINPSAPRSAVLATTTESDSLTSSSDRSSDARSCSKSPTTTPKMPSAHFSSLSLSSSPAPTVVDAGLNSFSSISTHVTDSPQLQADPSKASNAISINSEVQSNCSDVNTGASKVHKSNSSKTGSLMSFVDTIRTEFVERSAKNVDSNGSSDWHWRSDQKRTEKMASWDSPLVANGMEILQFFYPSDLMHFRLCFPELMDAFLGTSKHLHWKYAFDFESN
ncbi:unnamed protein product [Protopolystoma xenopodis]|uniref:Uncharacterized protein n=1 Tax=Protopolystoma xenopodis TaxID=117903 RepID=A0A3S5C2K6_9PLAT|nr:unnamed protein product [Protopolystoma xenopodis]